MVNLTKLKEILAIGSADTVGSGISAIFWFYLASQIEPESFGELQWFLGIAAVTSTVALFGSLNVITIHNAKKIQLQSTYNFISLLSSLILSTVVIILFPSFFQIDIGIIIFAYVINTLAVGSLLGNRLYSSYSKYTLIQKCLTLGLGIPFLYFFGYESIILALSLSYVFYIKKIIQNFREMKINLSLIKPRIGFILNNYGISLIHGFHGQIDKIIVAPLLGFVILGNYSLALQIMAMMLIFSNVLYKYFIPNDAAGVSNSRIKIYSILGSVLIALFGIIVLPFLIPALFPKFTVILEVIPYVSIYVISYTIAQILESNLLGKLRSKHILIGDISSLSFMVVRTITLAPILGIIGVGICLVLNSFIRCGIFFYATQKLKK